MGSIIIEKDSVAYRLHKCDASWRPKTNVPSPVSTVATPRQEA